MTCSIEGCTAPVLAKGLCGKHYMRVYRHGDPTVRMKRPRDAPKTWALIDKKFPHWSERTKARFYKASVLLHWLKYHQGIDTDEFMRAARFANGKVNAYRLLDLTTARVRRHFIESPHLLDDE